MNHSTRGKASKAICGRMGRVAVAALVAAFFCAGEARGGVEEPVYVIDAPTSGLLGHGEYQVQGRVGPQSSIQLGLRVGLRDVLQVGVSFGAQRIFERSSVDVNERVGIRLRIRLIPEGAGPALAIGFDNQGVGAWNGAASRYERKSKGFYGVFSRNWRLAVGQLSIHGGANISTENADENGTDVFAAGDWEVVRGLSVLADWSAGLNDNIDDGVYGRGRSYLDAAIRVSYGENLSMMLTFRDLTGNYTPDPSVWREFEVVFVDFF